MTYKLKIDKRKFIVFAQVKGVNKNRQLSFLLDTGATKSVIDEDAVQRLGFELHKLPHGDRLMTAGGAVSSRILKVPKLSLFGKDLVNFEVNVLNLSKISYSCDGLLGTDFLLKFKSLKFDFVEKTVETT